jgi:hypothetical protein
MGADAFTASLLVFFIRGIRAIRGSPSFLVVLGGGSRGWGNGMGKSGKKAPAGLRITNAPLTQQDGADFPLLEVHSCGIMQAAARPNAELWGDDFKRRRAS